MDDQRKTDTDLGKIRLTQIKTLYELSLTRSLRVASEILNTPETTLGRQIKTLEDKLGFALVTRDRHDLTVTDKGKAFLSQVMPHYEQIILAASRQEQEKEICIRFAGGGSLVVWLAGKRITKLKRLCHDNTNHNGDSIHVRSDSKPMSNKDTLYNVAAQNLDFGMVRSGILDERLPIHSEKLGVVTYQLYIPHELAAEYGLDEPQSVSQPLEKTLLQKLPLATVGPDGEFRHRLDGELASMGVNANIEFSYRAFPMAAAHLFAKSHAVIMPNVSQYGVEQYANLAICINLSVLQSLKRTICLIVHASEDKRPNWLNTNVKVRALKKLLSF